MKKAMRAVGIVLALTMLLAACGRAPASSAVSPGAGPATSPAASSAASAPAAPKKDTITLRNVADTATFVPFATTDLNDWKQHYQLFDSLSTKIPTGHLRPPSAPTISSAMTEPRSPLPSARASSSTTAIR